MNEKKPTEEEGKKPSYLSDILKNALKTTKAEEQKASVETKKCKSCQAARPEGTDLQFCDYCGYQFY